jgi:hypothetical protein
LISDSSDEWLHRTGEELGESESLARITTEGCLLGGIKVGEHGLVESEVGPAGKESKDRKPQGGPVENRGQRQKEDRTDVQKRESRDSERYDASEERHGVCWDELTESDKESDLHRNGSCNDGQAKYPC